MDAAANRWITGKDFNLRILREHSLTDLVCEVFGDLSSSSTLPRALPREKIDKLSKVTIDGLTYKKLWTRNESDSRGSYIAVAYRLEL